MAQKKYLGSTSLAALVDNIKTKYAQSSHKHSISDVTNLQSSLNGKVPTSRTVNGKALSSNVTLTATDVGADVSGAASTALSSAKEYTDTHVNDTTVHASATEKSNWNAAYTHSTSAHAPSNAEKNQNAFSNVKVGNTVVAADTTTDTLTLSGSNVTLTPDATNDKVTIGITKDNVVGALGYTPPTTNTTYSNATTSKAGLMSASDKTKLDGIATGAQKNQNAFSNIKVGEDTGAVTVAADSATDTLTLVAGDYVEITPDATNDKITISATAALDEAKSYADGVKDSLLNGAGDAYDTLKELGDLIDTNTNAIDALREVASGKADKKHTHAIADVTGLQTALDNKASVTHGTHVTYSTTAPLMDGTASVGTAGTVARSDHRHPTDTSRASAEALTSHTSNTNNPHKVTKAQVGLGNVDNTADSAKSVASAAKLTTARNIKLTGDVTGSASFNGTADASITATVADNSHNHTIANVTNLQSTLDKKATVSTLTNEDLDKVTTVGFYNAGGSNSVTNKPSGVDHFGLVVTHNASGSYYTQMLYNDSGAWRRTCTNGTWGGWTQDKYTDTNTTYSAGAGLTLSGTQFKHSNSVTAGTAQGSASKTLTFGSTFTIPAVTYDAQGHITSKATTTMTMPANPNTHYTSKNVVGSSTATSDTTTALTNGNVYLNNVENGAVTSTHKISGSGATTVTTDEKGNIVIKSTDNNTTYKAATSSALGLVKSGTDITVDASGNVSVNDNSHNHTIANITNLQSTLDGKASTSHTHDLSTMINTLSTGTATPNDADYFVSQYAGGGTTTTTYHRRPVSALWSYIKGKTDGLYQAKGSYDAAGAANTALASAKEYTDTHANNTTKHITATERTNWNNASVHAGTAHAPSNAEKNQNAFSNVKVGSGNSAVTVAADAPTDTLTLVAGSNVTITPDADTDTITISSTDTNTKYSAGTGITLSGTTFSNSGVRSIATGGTNGTISVNTNGTSANVAVKGLGSAAYTATSAYDAAGAANTALASAKSYTDTQFTNKVGSTTVPTQISNHNTSTTAHSDIRALITDLTTKLNNFLDVDDETTDQLSEIITLINNNKGTIESLTTSKVNVSDIVNNLTTASTSKVLSANQGVEIKKLIDALQTSLNSHTHKYAGSSTAGGAATSANKLNTNAGSATQPVYFANGIPVNTTYSLNKTVPSDAKFTDTTYSAATKSNAGLMTAADKIKADFGGIDIVSTSGTGAAYTATVSGMTELKKGMKVTIIPHTVSTSTAPTLNINSLGAKTIRMPVTYTTSATSGGATASWLASGVPVTIEYNGTYWVTTDMQRPSAQYLYGTVPVGSGGTGATTAAQARINLGIQTSNGTVTSGNADYAEVGEWADGNTKSENRIGYFVSVDTSTAGKTMVKATSTSDVRGVTVTAPAFSGNCDSSKFSNGTLLAKYSYVAVMGFASVIDNGTCTVNGRCMPADDGTAVPSSNNLGYQVIERVDSTHVIIAVEPSGDMLSRIKTDVTNLQNRVTPIANGGTGANNADSAISNLGAQRKVLSGSSAPSDSLGKNGDLYVALSSSAIKSDIVDLIYPVGSIYISVNSTNPSTLFGGTWEAFGQGRTLIGAGTGNDGSTSLSFTAEKTGGEYKHKLTVEEMPRHYHTGLDIDSVFIFGWDLGDTRGFDLQAIFGGAMSYTGNRITTGGVGGNQSHNNLQPYVVTYMWKRTK